MSEDQMTTEDGSPRHKHLRKLAAEAEAIKKEKDATKPLKIEYELAYDTRGKPKYRKLTYMPNGNKHSEYVTRAVGKAKFEQQKKNR